MKARKKILRARGRRAKVLSSRMVFRGSVFGVRSDRVIEPGGITVTREIVTHPGSVVVLPVFPNGEILLIQQYRHSVGGPLWELVAGRIEAEEDPLTAARRELLEETGYTARRIRKLFVAYPTPGFVNESMTLFAAEGLRSGTARLEPDEKIIARRFAPDELKRWIRTGRIRDGKTIAGLLYYFQFVRRARGR